MKGGGRAGRACVCCVCLCALCGCVRVCVFWGGTVLSSNFIQIQGHQYCNRRCKPLRGRAPWGAPCLPCPRSPRPRPGCVQRVSTPQAVLAGGPRANSHGGELPVCAAVPLDIRCSEGRTASCPCAPLAWHGSPGAHGAPGMLPGPEAGAGRRLPQQVSGQAQAWPASGTLPSSSPRLQTARALPVLGR